MQKTRSDPFLLAAILVTATVVAASAQSRTAVRTIAWADVAPVHAQLEKVGVGRSAFAARVDAIRRANARRVQEGDLDHLIFYLLQSTKFTNLPVVEPALSAKWFAETNEIPELVRRRTSAFLSALRSWNRDPRLAYFRELADATFPDRTGREPLLLREYARVMKFVYEKEFVAQRSNRREAAVAELYRTRGLSTDTAVEAGFLVADGLAIVRALNPDLRIRRVLIVGPGLDLAPRTSLVEAGPPESYQPWAVIDALLSLGLARAGELAVVGADINPRVVSHLRRASGRARTLTFVTSVRESDTVTFAEPFREYFGQLGDRLELARPPSEAKAASATRARERSEREAGGGGAPPPSNNADGTGHLAKTVTVSSAAAHALHAERLDIVTERLTSGPFDLVIATNILPYFDDVELLLAMTNIAAMLAPGGLFLHNETRPFMEDAVTAVGLLQEQSRHSVIATVRGAPPLGDSVFVHRKTVARGSRLVARGSRLVGRDSDVIIPRDGT